MSVTQHSPFLSTLLQAHSGSGAEAGWLGRLRSEALERANALSVPTPRDEEWRFTDLAPLTRTSFQPVHEAAAIDPARVQPHHLPETHARLVFVDGVFAPELSQLPSVAGALVAELRAAVEGPRGPTLEAHLGRLAGFDQNLFAALNTAFLNHGAAIVLDREVSLPGPVHVLHVATRRERAHAVYPRLLVVAAARSRCTVVEEYLGFDEAAYFSAPVTEIVLAEEASVEHVRLQREAASAFQLGVCAVSQGAGSRYRDSSIVLGARLSRLDIGVVQQGPGCETQLDGLTLIGGRQLADTHSAVEHTQPEGQLQQLHKCIAGGGAHAVFNGKILVRQAAQRTNAAQSCRGLLLSPRAHMDAKPQLEIFADDVKCAHGAAIGQLDPEAAFYLQSRGLPEALARNLLTYGFAAALIERVPVPSLVRELERSLLERTVEAA